ncbi:LysE family translocator [Agriterribacter humi]|jgi:threonine/homoserine/homoserine lactone efflux protein|uniref:LysE family translocator n=1 Tax=Agriterribacter humi TaxID=1104781 RepID=UPI001D026929|nr:LysE family transporter [Agriterribacter humi]
MIEALLKGLALGLILALSVGPVIFTIIKQSIYNGHEGGFSFVAGVWISDIVLVILSNAFTELVKELLEYKKLIGYTGSSFLLAMGVYYLFFKKVKIRANGSGLEVKLDRKDHTQIFLSGFLINTLNPSVIIFWLVNATAFAVTHTLQQRIIIFTTCILFNILADAAKVLLAGSLRKRLTVHNISLITKISGGILIGFAFALIYGIIFWSDKVH